MSRSTPADQSGNCADKNARGRLLFAQDCRFVLSAPKPEFLPPPDIPEVAFAGRSNSGKSSLINALVNRKSLAHSSRTPGRTRAINLFDLAGRLMLVDLPGYGFARASKSEMATWSRTIVSYLFDRLTLRRVCLLLDARRGLMEIDFNVLDLFDTHAVPYQIVLTKTDKLKRSQLDVLLGMIPDSLSGRPAALGTIVATSAKNRTGIDLLRCELEELSLPKGTNGNNH